MKSLMLTTAFPIRAATLPASSERPQTTQAARKHALTFRPSSDNTLRVLHLALDSCGRSIAAAENGLMIGSVPAVRLAFKHAEEAFEEAQHCMADVAAEDLPSDVEQRLSALGLRLDALWMRLVYVYR